jgi:hypothetical protein
MEFSILPLIVEQGTEMPMPETSLANPHVGFLGGLVQFQNIMIA